MIGMLSLVRPAILLLVLFTLLTGIAYPTVITAIATVGFPSQAHGSLVYHGDRIVGSELIGQPFDDPGYLWGRPSATAGYPYNAEASTGSNLGPSNPALHDAVAARVQALRAADPENHDAIPIDLVTASASGLDPHISPAAAYYQVPRIARARGLSAETVRTLIAAHITERTFRVLGEPRVNVLLVNLALDAYSKSTPGSRDPAAQRAM